MIDVRFLFVLCEGPEETVIDSQVVDTVVALRGEGIGFDLLFLADAGAALRKRRYYARRRAAIAERTGGSVRIVPLPRKRAGASLLPTAVLLAELARTRARRTLVHGRTEWSAYPARRAQGLARGLRYVYDARGDGEGEIRLEARAAGLDAATTERRVEQLRRVRRAAVAGAEHVLCVSSALRDLLVAQAGLDPARATVVPCVADSEKFHLDETERRAARAALGVEDRFVVVYPGRFGRWHFGAETCRVVRGLMQADPDVFFLVLTPDVDEAAAVAAQGGLPPDRLEIRTAEHAEVPRYLRAADAGILLRASDPLNEVACPTKFAEYVLCGLPVLISAGIGDCSGFVSTNDAGAVLSAPDPAEAASALRRIRREDPERRRTRIARAGAALSRGRFARDLAALYRRLAAAP